MQMQTQDFGDTWTARWVGPDAPSGRVGEGRSEEEAVGDLALKEAAARTPGFDVSEVPARVNKPAWPDRVPPPAGTLRA